MQFWSAKELRKEFYVQASFYKIEVANEIYQCRNQALILRKNNEHQEKHDALVIMANPGLCNPKKTDPELPLIKGKIENLQLVDSNDDSTQRQLMRLMKIMNWNVVSIVNLSDICAGNLIEFNKIISKLKIYRFENHTLFCPERVDEKMSYF